jgi:ParB family chromosome partitioning protein
LPEQIQQHINQGLLEMGHARALITLPVLAQLQLAEAAIREAWSVREMERQAQAWQQNAPLSAQKTSKAVDADVLRLQDAIADKLGLAVKIQANQQQKGKLVLHFNNAEEFQQMLNALNLDQLA